MDKGVWQATVHGVAKRVRHNVVTKQQQYRQYKMNSGSSQISKKSELRKMT